MNAAFQDAAFSRGRCLSEGGVFSKWLAEGAAFNKGRRSLEEIQYLSISLAEN